MTRKFILIVVLLAAFLLFACNFVAQATATPTAIPTGTIESARAGNCPFGTWQVQNFDSVLQTLLTSATGQTGTIGDITSSGTLHYTFGMDNKLAAQADQFQIETSLTVSGFPVGVQIDVAGSAGADFSVDQSNGTITYSNFDPGDLSIKASAGGWPSNQQIDPGYLMFGASQSATTRYQCQNGTLRITLPFAEAQGQAVVFTPANP